MGKYRWAQGLVVLLAGTCALVIFNYAPGHRRTDQDFMAGLHARGFEVLPAAIPTPPIAKAQHAA